VRTTGSYELTPFYQRDIDRLRHFSPRFFIMLAATTLFVLISRPFLLSSSNSTTEGYLFILGGFFLLELVVHLRHIRNIASFSYLRRSRGVTGQVCFTKGLNYRLSAIDLTTFSLCYLLLFLLTDRWFFLGGTLTCLTTASRHWRLGQQAGLAIPPEEQSLPAGSAEK
jgi:hypothetical protein